MPETRGTFIAVDPFGAAVRRNIGPLKQSLHHLKGGGCLALFPAGEVSSFDWHDRRIQDPPWTHHVAGLIRKTEAAVLPVFIDGHNSLLFQLSGMIHPRLRTVLLARELAARRAVPIHIYIGRPIPAPKLLKYDGDQQLIEYLRTATYFLRTRRHRKPLPK
ncbi:MAG: hypothetical protein HC901_02820 [Bdellovibrionaceae bacterium]|nr:hypothetical protein [Pseudobdellovibrionaceae bacterium]